MGSATPDGPAVLETALALALAFELELEFLLLPHRTASRSPSMSSPFAHACAAVSAVARSLKFTNAHLF